MPNYMLCDGWRSRCQNEECDHKYQRTDGITICPDCGLPRERCGAKAVPGYRYCCHHGGPNPKNNFYGLGGAVLKSGKTSQFDLTRLASTYIQMKTDGRLLTNRMSIEMIRTRIVELAGRIDTNQAPDRLANLSKLWRDYTAAKGTMDEMPLKLALDDEFERAYHDYAAWKQMFDAVDLDRKLVESEVKIIKDMNAVLTAEDAYELTAQLLAAIINTTNSIENVPDKVKLDFLKRIQYEFTRIVGERVKQGTPRGGAEDNDAEAGELDRTRILDPGDPEQSPFEGEDDPGAIPA